MRGLSGAHFAVFTSDGRVTDSTLPALIARACGSSGRADRLGARFAGRITDSAAGRHPVFRCAAQDPRCGPMTARCWCFIPRPVGGRRRWEAATPPLAVGLGTLGLMAAVTSWIAHRISGRIRRVQQQVARIAAGDFEGFDPGPRGDEVQDLAGSINLMCNQLKQMQQTIRQSERTRLLAQLAAGLAHQLRNSLTGARMSIQLHAKRFPPQGGDETLNVALRQLAMTEEQVKGLLSLGRVERQPHAPASWGGCSGRCRPPGQSV